MDVGVSKDIVEAIIKQFPDEIVENIAEDMCWYCINHPEWIKG